MIEVFAPIVLNAIAIAIGTGISVMIMSTIMALITGAFNGPRGGHPARPVTPLARPAVAVARVLLPSRQF